MAPALLFPLAKEGTLSQFILIVTVISNSFSCKDH